MNMLNDIFNLCIVPLLAVLVTYLAIFLRKKSLELQTKVDSELAAKYINMLTEIVIDCVQATNQTYVNELKEKDAFDEAAQAEALCKTYNAVMQLLSEDAREFLEEFYGDLPLLVNQLIESFILNSKK